MKIRITFVVLLSFFAILINLVWLAIGILVAGSLYILYYSPLRWSLWIRKNTVANFLLSFLVIIAVAVLLRVFIFEIYTIPSESMEDALISGDNVIMSKIHYGPAMPRSPFEIPWLGALFYLNKQARAKAFTDWWTYHRLDGLTHISRNDILVFTKDDSKECHIKRCVGLPGDTIKILRGKLWIDQSAYYPPATAKRYYKIWFNNADSLMNTVAQLTMALHTPEKRDKYVGLTLNEQDKLKIAARQWVDSVTIKPNYPESIDSIAYPGNVVFSWTVDNFGPLKIPAKGLTLSLDRKNFILYQDVIRRFEGEPLKEVNGKFYLHNNEIQEYTFRKNYYFMMGDNRNNSGDSRYWGFIPEERIIGKAVCVLFSNDAERIRWERTLHLL